MKNHIPVLSVADVAGCEREVIRSFAERLYLLFSDSTAVLVSVAANPLPGATVALALSDGKVHLGVYHPDGHGVFVENLFAAEKNFFDRGCIRWIFPVLQVKYLCVRKE